MDGPFKSMTRDPSTDMERRIRNLRDDHETRCDKCGALLYPGDWPWCEGRPGDHDR